AESMDLVRKNQPCDPSDPDPRCANDLHALIAEKLGLDDFSELKLYTAVGSPLDFWHGIDGFFEFRGHVLTIDLTVNSHKDSGKANMIVHPDDLDHLEL